MIGDAAVLRCGFSNPAEEESYLEALNLCFGHWGGREMFEWCFTRPGAGRAPDVLSLWLDGRVIAGSAISYRRVMVGGGPELAAGIMTGAWTLPEARGAGAFTRLIHASREQAARRGGALLLAFVTATNASCRRLRREGAELLPTYYCRSDRLPARIEPTLREESLSSLDLSEFQRGRNETRFVYTAAEWLGQFIDRPGDLRAVAGQQGWKAIVECTAGFDRVHALAASPEQWTDAIDALTARALSDGRNLFAFTTSVTEAKSLRERGFAITDGFLTVMAADAARLSDALGVPPDCAEPHGLLADRQSPWFLGPWTLQNGDRM